MSRESKAIPKMIGIENEYGCLIRSKLGNYYTDEGGAPFVWGFKPEWFSFARSGAWDPTARLRDSHMSDNDAHEYFKDTRWQSLLNFLMPNGARFYLDMAHPEICIPICRNPLEALLHDRACEWMMNFIREKHYEVYGNEYRLFKNNTALGDELGGRRSIDSGVSYSTHENYLVSRGVSIKELVAKELPFLVIRTVLTGAGKVWAQNGQPHADYQLSQRSDFFGHTIGLHTTGTSRPIKNFRDHPYADHTRFRRVHVIPGDGNMCEMAEFLKLGLTSIMFMMIEDGFLDDRFSLVNPVSDFHQISRDIYFREKIHLSEGVSKRPIDLMKEYADLMWEYFETFGIRDEILRMAVTEARRLLGLLDSHMEDCFGELDHVTKRMLIEGAIEKGRVSSWRDAKAKMMDVQYANINPTEGLFYRPKTYARMKKLLTEVEVERAVFSPPPTRSRFQVEVNKRFGVVSWDWQKTFIAMRDRRELFVVCTDDPSIHWEKLEGLLCDDREEFFNRCTEAGMTSPNFFPANISDSYRFVDTEASEFSTSTEQGGDSLKCLKKMREIEGDEEFLHKKWLEELRKFLEQKKSFLTEREDEE